MTLTAHKLHELIGSPEHDLFIQQVYALASSDKASANGALLAVIRGMKDDAEAMMKATPRLDCVDIKRSVCYVLGRISALEDLLETAATARKILSAEKEGAMQ
jgi:hypothetical protein